MNNEIILSKLIERISNTTTSPHSNIDTTDGRELFSYKNISNTSNNELFIYFIIVILVFFGISKYTISLNIIFSIIVSYGLLYFILSKDNYIKEIYNNNTELKLRFLENLMINKSDNQQLTSYLYLNPPIIEFYYNTRENITYNMSNFRESLISVNNMLMLDEQSKDLNNPFSAYISIQELSTETLNHYQSIIHSMPYNKEVFDKFNKSLSILQSLLLNIVNNVKKKCQNKNKRNITTDTIPDSILANESVIKSDDTKSYKYSNNYNFY